MKDTTATIIASILGAIVAAVLASVIANVFVVQQIEAKERMAATRESMTAYIGAITESVRNPSSAAIARANASGRLSVALDAQAMAALSQFERGITESSTVNYLITEKGQREFVNLLHEIRRQFGADEVSDDTILAVLLGGG